MGGSGPGNSIATSRGARTLARALQMPVDNSCASGGRYAAGFARGRSRREVCGSSGGRWSSSQLWKLMARLAFEQVCRTNVVMKKVISFRDLDPRYPFYLDRGSSIVTKEVCGARSGRAEFQHPVPHLMSSLPAAIRCRYVDSRGSRFSGVHVSFCFFLLSLCGFWGDG